MFHSFLSRSLAGPALPRRVVASLVAFLSACALGPDEPAPAVPTPPAYKEAPPADAGWRPAAPADALDRGPWW
ncbi:MAG: hypothetical protein M3O01_16935, partial [Pseudomonadota bacterium]|nr:hypothetical protein [Pseudomonadota bacterium]